MPAAVLRESSGIGSGALILHEGVAEICLWVVHHLPFINHHGPHLRDLRNHIVMVVNTREAVLGSAFDLAAIGAAGTGLYIALVGLGQAHIGWVGAIGTYAIGNAAATITALPGGLGAHRADQQMDEMQLGHDLVRQHKGVKIGLAHAA